MLTYSITRALCLTVVWPNLWVKKIFSREPWTLDLYFETLSLSYFIFQKECWGLGGSLVFCFLFQFLTLQGISSVYSTISRLGLICFKVYEISKSTVIISTSSCFFSSSYWTYFLQVYEISMSTVIQMECDDCSPAKLIEEETVSHIREKVTD